MDEADCRSGIGAAWVTPFALTVTGISKCRHGRYVGAYYEARRILDLSRSSCCDTYPFLTLYVNSVRENAMWVGKQFRTRMMYTSDPADVSLLQRVAARDTTALAELYDRHSRLLFGLILRIVRDRGEAEEILQEAFVQVWTRAETYDALTGGPLAWIVRVARSCAIDRLRARRGRAIVEAPAIGALAGLPTEQRQLIEAAFFEGYTHSELAQRFGLPLETVRTRIRAGMLATRKKLAHAV